MKVVADISLSPLGVGASVSNYIAECERVFTDVGMRPNVHAEGTEVEGDWEQVFQSVKRCHERLHAMGVEHIETTIRMSTRTDVDESITRAVRSVREKTGV